MTDGFAILAPILPIALAFVAIMSAAWLVQQRTGNSGWVDTIWTFGLGAVGAAAALWPSAAAAPARQWAVALLVAAWSLRLGLHIAIRTARVSDDPRYNALSRQWGEAAPRKMYGFLMKQAAGSVPLAFTIWLAAHHPAPGLRFEDFLGLAILAVGILGETVADRQLATFRATSRDKGRICDVGLWKFSRHPNYFFEWFAWLAYPVIAIDLAGGYPAGWLALMGPAFMYFFLVHGTGIPHLEDHLLRTRGAAFLAYRARTNAFFPGIPK